MKLLLLFSLSTVIASDVETGCTWNSTYYYMEPNNETVDILCHSFPIIHQYVNKLLHSNVSIERTATMSSKSYKFVQYLMELNNGDISSNKQISECQFNDTGNLTVRNSLTPVKEGNMSISLWDILLNYTKNLKTRHVLVLLQDELGVTRKQFMKQLVDIKAEVQVDHCKNYMELRQLNRTYNSLILNCNSTHTETILKYANFDDLFIESISWLIACENCTIIEQSFETLEAIADVVLLQLSDYMQVTFKYTHSALRNNSTEVIPLPKNMCHMTRLQKTCKHIPLQHTNYLLHSNKDIETLYGFSIAQTLSGCKFLCTIYNFPPYTMESPNGFEGIDYEFSQLITNTLGITMTYSFFSLSDVLLEQLLKMDIGLPYIVNADDWKDVVDVSPSIVFTYFSGNIRRPSRVIDAKNSLKAYLSPFTTSVWGWISLVAIANVLAWALVRRFHHRKQTLSSNAPKIAMYLWKSLFDTLSVLPNQGASELLPVTSYKIILVTISLFTALYMTCYSAVLITYLSDRRMILPFTSLEGFADDQDYHILLPTNDTNIEYQLAMVARRAKSGVYQKIHFTKKHNYYANYQELWKRKWLLVSLTEFNEFISGLRGSFVGDIKDFPESTVAIKNIMRSERNLIFRKGFPHQAIFFRTARKLVEAGLYQKLHAYTMNGIRLRKKKNEEVENVIAVELNSVVFLLAICLIGWTMSLIAFIIELLIDRRIKSSVAYANNIWNP